MRSRIQAYISKWKSQGYSSGIPDEAPIELERHCKAPSYRAICRAILTNDVALKSLGFGAPKTQAYMALKKVEIENRERIRCGQSKNSDNLC